MKEKGAKHWVTILTNMMPATYLNVLQASNPNQTVQYQLTYIYSVAGCVDMHLLRDLGVLVNAVAKNRFTNFG